MQNMTRRSLLQQGGALLGGLAAVPLFGVTPGDGAAVTAAPGVRYNAAHWGAFTVDVADGRIVRLAPFAKDPHPNWMLRGTAELLSTPNRIKSPMIRRGFYKDRARSNPAGRGSEPFVRVSWDEAIGIVADELRRVKTQYGNRAIYGGSYGWQSPGRFHGRSPHYSGCSCCSAATCTT